MGLNPQEPPIQEPISRQAGLKIDSPAWVLWFRDLLNTAIAEGMILNISPTHTTVQSSTQEQVVSSVVINDAMLLSLLPAESNTSTSPQDAEFGLWMHEQSATTQAPEDSAATLYWMGV